MISGQAVEVRVEPRGSSLAQDAAAGATAILVEDPTAFDSEGGLVLIDGLVHSYSSVTEVDSVDDPEVDNAWLDIDPPLASALPESEPVFLWSGTQVMDDMRVAVDIGDPEQVVVTLLSGQRKDWTLKEGPLDPPVAVSVSDDLQRIVDAPGLTPDVGGTFLTHADGPRGMLEDDRLSFWSGDDVNLPVLIQAIVEEARQVLRLSSGRQSVGDIDAQIVLQSAPSPVLREIILRTGIVRALGELRAEAGSRVQNGLTVESGAVEFLGNAGVTLDTYLVLQRGNNRLFGFRSGSVLRTMNADGRTTIAHNFPVTPSAVHANLLGSGVAIEYYLHVVGKNASDFTVEARRRDNNTVANGVELRVEYTVTSTDS